MPEETQLTQKELQDLCVLNRIFFRIRKAQEDTQQHDKTQWECDYYSLFGCSPNAVQKTQLWDSMQRLKDQGLIQREELRTSITPEGLWKIGVLPKFDRRPKTKKRRRSK